MFIRLPLIAITLFALVSLFPALAAAEEGEATRFVQERADEILSIVNRSVSGDEAVEQRREDLRGAIRNFLSFELLAERTLSRHWEARSEDERSEFVALLRQLIETSYLQRLGDRQVSDQAYEARYTGERERRGVHTVEGRVQARGDEVFVEVRLRRNENGAWLIFDVITDDVSLEESYAESFDRIIRDEGWGELLQRLRDRIRELEEA